VKRWRMVNRFRARHDASHFDTKTQESNCWDYYPGLLRKALMRRVSAAR